MRYKITVNSMGEKHEGKNKKRRTKSESKQEGSGVKQGQNRRVDEVQNKKRSCMEFHTAS